jgi:murein peptide amidase A
MSVVRTRCLLSMMAMTALVVTSLPSSASAREETLVTDRFVIGQSVQHRDITVVHRFHPGATVRVVVIGNIHGDEQAGFRVIKQLRELQSLPNNLELFLIRTANPDGTAANTRTNTHGVDLNRNFPYHWRSSSRGSTWSGRRPLTEPESLTLRAFVLQIKPDLVVVFHQPLFGIGAQDRTMPVVRRLSRETGLPVRDFRCTGVCAGSFTSWLNNHAGMMGVTVEFGHTVSESRIRRTAGAVISVGAGL